MCDVLAIVSVVIVVVVDGGGDGGDGSGSGGSGGRGGRGDSLLRFMPINSASEGGAGGCCGYRERRCAATVSVIPPHCISTCFVVGASSTQAVFCVGREVSRQEALGSSRASFHICFTSFMHEEHFFRTHFYSLLRDDDTKYFGFHSV